MLKKSIQHAIFKNGFSSLLILLVGSSVANAGSVSEAKSMGPDKVSFEQIAPFVKMGGAWGDRSQGAHGTFGQFPGGASSPLHTHSGAYHGIVISGVMTNPFENEENPTKMEAGGYWFVPAGVEHVTACVSNEPCLFYFHSESAFDFTPVGQ